MRLNLSTGALTLPMLEERHFGEVEACAQAVAGVLGDNLTDALAERGQASLAVSGGRTPQTVFPLLAARTLAWDKVAITLTDERWVAVDNADSNEKLAREYLLKGEAKAARFVGLKTPDTTPSEGLKACEGELATVPLPLDTAYLGMGEDGHIASLFPGSDALSQESGLCAAAVAPGGQHRMSLSPKALLSARHLILMLSGDEKRKIYEAAKKPGRVVDLPLRLILHQNQVPLTVFIS